MGQNDVGTFTIIYHLKYALEMYEIADGGINLLSIYFELCEHVIIICVCIFEPRVFSTVNECIKVRVILYW